MTKSLRWWLGLCVWGSFSQGLAALDVELTKGAVALPQVEIQDSLSVPFFADFSQVLLRDLKFPGRLEVQLSSSARGITDYKASFKLEGHNGQEHALCMYLSLGGAGHVSGQQEKLHCEVFAQEAWRRHVHQYAQALFRRLVGKEGPFLHKIAYVRELMEGKKKRYQLEISDYDGGMPKVLLVQNEPLTSLSVSPNGRFLSYVSFEKHKSSMMLYDLKEKRVDTLPSYPGVNGMVAWSPDSKKVAMSLSISGSMQLYVMDIESKVVSKVTSSSHIEVDPVWSKDGKSIYFASHRGAEGVQIYKVHVASGEMRRISEVGHYNVSPSLSEDEGAMVYLSRVDSRLQAVLLDRISGQTSLIGSGRLDDAPKITKDGQYVVMPSIVGGRRMLGLKALAASGMRRLPIQTPGKFVVWVESAPGR